MPWRTTVLLSVILLVQVPATAATAQRDSDGDGIWDIHERILGTDPNDTDVPQTILPDGIESEAARQRSSYDATMDMVDIAMCHVGDDRYLYQLNVLCHAISKPGSGGAYMSDSTGKHLIAGVPLSARAKIMRLCDYRDNHRVAATFGLDILRAVLRSEQTLVVPHDQLQLDGFVVDDFTSKRWPHVSLKAVPGAVKAKAPRSGVFHIGFMMYDDSGQERIGFVVDDRVRGVAVANQDNNRTWLYWLEEPLLLRQGQEIELRAEGGSGRHGIINMLFLPQPPEQRRIEYRIENMASAVPVDRPRQVTVSWTTTWPCPIHVMAIKAGYPPAPRPILRSLTQTARRCMSTTTML